MLWLMFCITSCEKAEDLVPAASVSDATASSGSDSSGSSGDDGNSDTAAEDADDWSTTDTATIINGHVVALTTGVYSDRVRFTLVSLKEWNDLKLSETSKNALQSIAAAYQEGTMTGWHIPTKDEAKSLKDAYACNYDDGYSDAIKSLKAAVTALGGTKVSVYQLVKGYPAYRYFCSEADSTFSLNTNTNITKVGKSASYNLRLVKDTTIAVSDWIISGVIPPNNN